MDDYGAGYAALHPDQLVLYSSHVSRYRRRGCIEGDYLWTAYSTAALFDEDMHASSE